MKKLFLLSFILLFALTVFAQTKTYEREYEYQASDDDGKSAAKEKAIKEVQREILRELGTIVESRQKMKTESSGNISKTDFYEEINSYTSGRVNASVRENTEKWSENIYSATFIIEVDTTAFFAHLDKIIKQKEKALADSLDNIRKKAEKEREIQNKHLEQIAKIKADSLAKATKVSDLELAVKTARELFKQEQNAENPLRATKEQKERERQNAENQKNSAQKAFDNARGASDAHTDIGARRVENERTLLKEASDEHNKKSAEYGIAYDNWNAAVRRVETAKSNLSNAENNLKKELNIKTSTTASKESTPTYEVRSEISGEGKIKIKTAERDYDVGGRGLTVKGGKYRFFFEPKNKRWNLLYAEQKINGRNIYIAKEFIEGKNSALINIDSDRTIYADFRKVEKPIKEKNYNFDRGKFWGKFWRITSIVVGGAAGIGGIAMISVGGEEIPYNPHPAGSYFAEYYEKNSWGSHTKKRDEDLELGGIMMSAGGFSLMGLTLIVWLSSLTQE